METNAEEGVISIGSVLGMLLALFVIAAIAAAAYSGFFSKFFTAIKAGLACYNTINGNFAEIINCLIAIADCLSKNGLQCI